MVLIFITSLLASIAIYFFVAGLLTDLFRPYLGYDAFIGALVWPASLPVLLGLAVARRFKKDKGK